MMKTRFEHVPPGQTDPDPLPGDFILTHGGEFWSRVIHFGQGLRFAGKDQPYTFWNHTALVVDHAGAIVEALGTGVALRTIHDYEATQYTVVRIDASDEDRTARFDQAGNIDQQIAALRTVRDELARSKTSAQIVDVRFGDRPYFR